MVERSLAFVPVARPMLLSGLLEARLDVRSIADGDLKLGSRDRFEDELRAFSTDDGESVSAGARAAAFAQGSLTDDLELTLRLDSEDDERSRLFRDIRPDEFYQTYGDASKQLFDAQSKGRFYGRLQRELSYLQYGDFSTSIHPYSPLGPQELGRYTRTLNGVLGHLENEKTSFNAFASRDKFRQVVDEIPAQGVSGPYRLSRTDGLVNSERVEIVTRDRNQPAVVLKAEPMQRFLDYRIEPLTGRLIFMRPIPSVDVDLNPVVIRVSYETESGGDSFWVYGMEGQFKPVDQILLGGTYVRDDNPLSVFDLMSANASLSLGARTFFTGEYARTDSAGSLSGDAFRLELKTSSDRFDARLFYLDTDADFANPSAQALRGRREAGMRARVVLGPQTRLFGEAIRTEDLVRQGTRTGAQLGLEHSLKDWLRAEVGVRVADETRRSAGAATEGVTPNEVRSLRARLTSRLPWTTDASVFGEFEQDVASSSRRASIGGDYRLFGRAKLYARHEFISSLAGPYALNSDQKQNNTVFGVAADYLDAQSVFSEYRVRDAFSGREAQAAVGLRNLWTLGEGLRLHTSLERVAPLAGNGSDTFALTGAIEYTNSPLWRGSARAEYRSASDGQNVFGSLGYARKLSRNLSFLGNTSFSVMTDGERALERTRLGVAYRETDRNRLNALARYEHRYDLSPDLESAGSLTRTAHLLSSHFNFRLSTLATFSGQWASKWATDSSSEIKVSEQAHLVALRLRYDLTRMFDVGAIGRTLFAGGFESATWGVGAEIGALLANNLRVAAGYNLFGFWDDELSIDEQTDRGFYVQLGFKFDESLFGARRSEAPEAGRNQSETGIAVAWQRHPLDEEALARDTLASPEDRIVDGVILDDMGVFDHWSARIEALPADPTAELRYGRTLAKALLDMAAVEYTDNDRTPFPSALVQTVKRIMEEIEAGQTPTLAAGEVEGSTHVAPELWNSLLELKSDSTAMICAAENVASLEVKLLWAGNEELTCGADDPRPHLEHARILADQLSRKIETCPEAKKPKAKKLEKPEVPVPALSAEQSKEEIRKPRQIAVPWIYFAFDRSDLDDTSTAVLDSVVIVLDEYQELIVRLIGHTDARGSDTYNMALSALRVAAVQEYLESRGISLDRLKTAAAGEAQPYRSEPSGERDHALNRRVEIDVILTDGLPADILIRTNRRQHDIKLRDDN